MGFIYGMEYKYSGICRNPIPLQPGAWVVEADVALNESLDVRAGLHKVGKTIIKNMETMFALQDRAAAAHDCSHEAARKAAALCEEVLQGAHDEDGDKEGPSAPALRT
jgi:hypothetical protein